MRIRDFIEELEVVEKDHGNLPINKGAEDIDLEVCDDTLIITSLSKRS